LITSIIPKISTAIPISAVPALVTEELASERSTSIGAAVATEVDRATKAEAAINLTRLNILFPFN